MRGSCFRATLGCLFFLTLALAIIVALGYLLLSKGPAVALSPSDLPPASGVFLFTLDTKDRGAAFWGPWYNRLFLPYRFVILFQKKPPCTLLLINPRRGYHLCKIGLLGTLIRHTPFLEDLEPLQNYTLAWKDNLLILSDCPYKDTPRTRSLHSLKKGEDLRGVDLYFHFDNRDHWIEDSKTLRYFAFPFPSHLRYFMGKVDALSKREAQGNALIQFEKSPSFSAWWKALQSWLNERDLSIHLSSSIPEEKATTWDLEFILRR